MGRITVWGQDLRRAVEDLMSGWIDFGVTDEELYAKAAQLLDEAEQMLRERLAESLHEHLTGFDVARVAVARALDELAGERFVLDWLPGDTIDEIEREIRRRISRS